MTGEVEIGGLLVPTLLVWAVLALALSLPLRRVLAAAGFYRLVWHRALFDFALFVVLWAVVARFAADLPRLAAAVAP